MNIKVVVFDSDETFVFYWPEGWRVPCNGEMVFHDGIKYKVNMVEWVEDDDSVTHWRYVRLRVSKN